MKLYSLFACGVLIVSTMVLGRDKLILPNYKYEIIGSPTQADITEALNSVKESIETPPDLTSPYPTIRKANATLDAMARDTYIIKSIAQNNDTISVEIEVVQNSGERAGKNFTLGRTNDHLSILNKSDWLIHADTFGQSY